VLFLGWNKACSFQSALEAYARSLRGGLVVLRPLPALEEDVPIPRPLVRVLMRDYVSADSESPPWSEASSVPSSVGVSRYVDRASCELIQCVNGRGRCMHLGRCEQCVP
jgi:hypothetical protein